jgi:ABC-type transporter Mla subunit MlaD
MIHVQSHELSSLSNLISILTIGLEAVPETPLTLPLEVSRALAEARAQMKSLPEVIDNLNLAVERFQSVAAALTGMMSLAEEAASDSIDDEARVKLNAEFVDLSKVVAADAGRGFYQGPSLSLLDRNAAKSAAKIVRYLAPVIETLEKDLADQKRLIQAAIAETISFLNTVTQCYPEADPNLNLLAEATRPYGSMVSVPLLH